MTERAEQFDEQSSGQYVAGHAGEADAEQAGRRARMAGEDAAEHAVPDEEERSPDQATVSSSSDPEAARLQDPGR